MRHMTDTAYEDEADGGEVVCGFNSRPAQPQEHDFIRLSLPPLLVSPSRPGEMETTPWTAESPASWHSSTSNPLAQPIVAESHSSKHEGSKLSSPLQLGLTSSILADSEGHTLPSYSESTNTTRKFERANIVCGSDTHSKNSITSWEILNPSLNKAMRRPSIFRECVIESAKTSENEADSDQAYVPNVSPPGLVSQYHRLEEKEHRTKTKFLNRCWAFALVLTIVVLSGIFIPLLIIFANGTTSSVNNYFSRHPGSTPEFLNSKRYGGSSRSQKIWTSQRNETHNPNQISFSNDTAFASVPP